jgi:Na+-driven multidrug efflux pump
LNAVFISCFAAIGVGGTVVVAQYAGRDDVKKANETTKQALFAAVMIAVLVSLVIWIFKNPYH